MPEWIWKWRREILFSLLIVISLGLTVSERDPGRINQGLREGLGLCLLPFQRFSSLLLERNRDWLQWFVTVRSLRAQNAELTRRVESLSLQNALLSEKTREVETLRSELAYKREHAWTFIPAKVIGRDFGSWLERVVLDRGASDGIGTGDGLVTPEGVAGRITQVNTFSSVAMLLPDPQSSVAGRVERSGVEGTVKGMGQNWLKLTHVPNGEDVKPGDLVRTSDLSSLFPPGLDIGEVVRSISTEGGLMLDVWIKPRLRFKTANRFFILKARE